MPSLVASLFPGEEPEVLGCMASERSQNLKASRQIPRAHTVNTTALAPRQSPVFTSLPAHNPTQVCHPPPPMAHTHLPSGPLPDPHLTGHPCPWRLRTHKVQGLVDGGRQGDKMFRAGRLGNMQEALFHFP